ncbi:MAG: hypothetical protein ACYTFG_00305 [Planctomycetota bacterium]|jgi:hypothetical protein
MMLYSPLLAKVTIEAHHLYNIGRKQPRWSSSWNQYGRFSSYSVAARPPRDWPSIRSTSRSGKTQEGSIARIGRRGVVSISGAGKHAERPL